MELGGNEEGLLEMGRVRVEDREVADMDRVPGMGRVRPEIMGFTTEIHGDIKSWICHYLTGPTRTAGYSGQRDFSISMD